MRSGSTSEVGLEPHGLLLRKRHLRQHFRSLRESMSAADVAAASAGLCERLAAWEVLARARTAMLYLAFRNELDVRPLVASLRGIRWVVPRVTQQEIVPHLYDSTRLTPHRFGMLEPTPDLPIVDSREVDLVLVPGVAFDRRGCRLGFGGGYYDRFLPRTPALRVGLTYDLCLVDELPCGERDQRMDWIVTPTTTICCRTAG